MKENCKNKPVRRQFEDGFQNLGSAGESRVNRREWKYSGISSIKVI